MPSGRCMPPQGLLLHDNCLQKAMRTSLWASIMAIAAWAGCRPALTSGPFSNGRFRADQFIAAGDGYVAGLADGGLYRAAQEGCFPALIAKQLALSKALTFRQALADNAGSGYLSLAQWASLSGCSYAAAGATTQLVPADASWPGVATSQGAVIHNMGLPGLMPEGTGQIDSTKFSLFWRRVEANPFGRSYAGHAARVGATGCVVWLGLESLAKMAATGKILSKPIVSVEEMTLQVRPLLDSLCKNGNVTGVVGTIPSVGLLPLCNTIGNTWFSDNCDPLPIFITTRTGQVRAATGQDRVLLVAGGAVAQGQGLSSLVPLPDSLVLDRDEMAHLDSLKDCYNAAWKLAVATLNAQGNTLIIADVEAAFGQLAQRPQAENGVTISTLYLMGGIFSHDGYTLTRRGNAWLANQFLAEINRSFEATLPLLELGRFEGTQWP